MSTVGSETFTRRLQRFEPRGLSSEDWRQWFDSEESIDVAAMVSVPAWWNYRLVQWFQHRMGEEALLAEASRLERRRLEQLGLVGLAWCSLPNLYTFLMDSGPIWHAWDGCLTRTASMETATCRSTFRCADPHMGDPRPLLAYAVALEVHLARVLVDPELAPREVWIPITPERPELWQSFFRSPTEFGTPIAGAAWTRDDLDLEIPGGHEELARYFLDAVTDPLHEPHTSTTEQVADVIGSMLHQQPPTIADVALQLGITTTALKQRLSREGISFRRLVDETRRDCVAVYLAEVEYSLEAVATLAGFRSRTSLNRAVQRWFGASPTELRRARGDD